MHILDEIRQAEERALEMRQQAHHEARAIQREAEQLANDASCELLNRSEEKAQETLAAARSSAEEKAAQFLHARAEEDEEAIREAEQNLKKAVSFILREAGVDA